ncbi:MAG: F0F1 ATP synthase subunit epsilon [Bartonella sp.]|nr:F0F1 ATP synthase subunit epsilon [Bartonella sp.]
MAGTFLFELVSPEKLLLSEQVYEVILPGSEGYITVLPNHSPLMTAVIPGVIKVKVDNGEMSFVVYGGFADITPERCSLLAEAAVSVEDFTQHDLDQRIEAAKDVFKVAENDEDRNKAEDFLHQLTIIPDVISKS